VNELRKCDPPHGGGPFEVNSLFNRIIDDYLDTQEYEQNRSKLRHCPPEFRQAFFRICQYDPSLATKVQVDTFVSFAALLVRRPEFLKYYQRFFRAAQANNHKISPAEIFYRTTWELKIERKRLPSAYAVDHKVSRFLAEYFALINPDLPNVLRDRKLRYTGARNLIADDELIEVPSICLITESPSATSSTSPVPGTSS
jgi:hypothetical protein